MEAVFVESNEFTAWIAEHLSDDEYSEIQREIMANPQKGALIPGCHGLRKLRASDRRRRKGKRGGIRLIYLHVPLANRFYMLDVYGKDEQEDLTPQDRKELGVLADELKRQAIISAKRAKGT